MKKLLIIEKLLNGLVKLVKAIRCKSACCQSSCNEPVKECDCDKLDNVVDL